jgi:hypothetical protein
MKPHVESGIQKGRVQSLRLQKQNLFPRIGSFLSSKPIIVSLSRKNELIQLLLTKITANPVPRTIHRMLNVSSGPELQDLPRQTASAADLCEPGRSGSLDMVANQIGIDRQ